MNNSIGKKYDHEKIQPSIVLGDFSRALIEVCRAGDTGIIKYGPGNWLKVENAAQRYDNAMIRHWLQSKIESTDSESNLLHLAHTAWNALACLELELRSQSIDYSLNEKISVQFVDGTKE